MAPILLLCQIILIVQKSYVESKVVVAPIVNTPAGIIRGVSAPSGNHYLGIPYAKVDETNVFGVSTPHPRFEGVFEANDDSTRCTQFSSNTVVGSIDCLKLNVYVPNSATLNNPLPVMVYIYGGGFSSGDARRSSYGPKYLIRHDVILVTINYRLGIFGFMCFDTPEVPGNQGLKDQIAALRWVKNNIASFGGDPNKVTVFANSAGGISIGLHLVSEAEQLFANGIMQSGSPLFNAVVTDNVSKQTVLINLAQNLGYQTNNVKEALAFLSKADKRSVMEAASAMNIRVGPCIEQDFPGVEKYLSERPINSKFAKAANTSLLVGVNNAESISFFPYQETPAIFSSWRQIFLEFLQSNFNLPQQQLLDLESILRRFYIGDEEISNDIRHELSYFHADYFFVYPAVRGIQYYLNGGTKKVYQYIFSYEGKRNLYKILRNSTNAGAEHTEELGYLFEMDLLTDEPTDADQLIIDRMTTLWTNFAKYSDPMPNTSELLPVKWEPITKGSSYNYLNINSLLKAERRYETRRMTFWDLIYNTHGEYELGYIDASEEEEKEEDKEDSSEDGDDDDSDEDTPGSACVTYLSPILFMAVFVNIFK